MYYKQGLMLIFLSQNDIFFLDQLGVLKRTDPGDRKPTYF